MKQIQKPAPARNSRWPGLTAILLLVLAIVFAADGTAFAQSSVRPPEGAVIDGGPVGGAVPGDALGSVSDTEIWRGVRHGMSGSVTIPDKKAAILVQSDGQYWREVRQGPLYSWLGIAILATVLLLAIFFTLRGRIMVEHGLSGKKITRFSTFERSGHWLMAISFLILAISGLNISFGRELVMPLIGKEAFGPISGFLKLSHNYVAFAFMLGLAIAFVSWVLQNIPNRYDLVWLAKGGGLFSKGVHPPAKKFNAGQKIIFWAVMIGGLSLSISGWALLFPFEHEFFGKTFVALSGIGIDVPAMLGIADPPYSVIQEQQFNTIWHAIVAVAMVCLILAHIYIGSIGMQGAFDAMGSGEVDMNWAREHHSLWVEEKLSDAGAAKGKATVQPAE
jgi:formate dehydrogenase subunit gamma